MEKQMEHTPTPYRMVPSIKVPRETIQASGGQQIAVIGEQSIMQGTPEGNRNFILRACNNHDVMVSRIELLVDAIDGEGEHDEGTHEPEECDVCDAVDDAKALLARLKQQGETGANDLLLEAVELIEIAKEDAGLRAASEDTSPPLRAVYESYLGMYEKWLDKAKRKP